MLTLSASKARSRLDSLLAEVAESHQPVQITGKRTNGILIAEEDWTAIQETLYLTGVPPLRRVSKRRDLAALRAAAK